MCQECAPLVTCIWRVWLCVGVPLRQPRPYFQDAGARPGWRSNVSTLVSFCQSMTRV